MQAVTNLYNSFHSAAKTMAEDSYFRVAMHGIATLGTGYLVYRNVNRSPRAVAVGMLFAAVITSKSTWIRQPRDSASRTARSFSIATSVALTACAIKILAHSQGSRMWSWAPLPNVIMDQASKLVTIASFLSSAALGASCALSVGEAARQAQNPSAKSISL